VVALLQSSEAFPTGQVESSLLERYPVRFGNLSSTRNRRRFISHWLTTKQFQRSGLDPEEFAATVGMHATSYSAFLGLFFDAIAARQCKQRWLEKTPGHVFHIRELLTEFPSARVIHVVRDGRDVAASRRKQGWFQTRSRNPTVQLIYAAKAWEQAVLAGKACASRVGGRYLEIRYEDIIGDTAYALAKIGKFVGLDLSMETIRKNPLGVLRESNTHFGDQQGGIERSGVGRWRTLLEIDEVLAVEQAVGATLTALGYVVPGLEEREPSTSVRNRVTAFVAGSKLTLHRRLSHNALFGAIARRFVPPD
jgi:hypothetical protein